MNVEDPRASGRRLVVVIPDGAAEPGRTTSLVRARTPHLDALCASQGVGRLTTIPAGCHPGTEVGVARLAGITSGSPARGWLEAAAVDAEVGEERAAWRLDVTAGDATAEQLMTELGASVDAQNPADVEIRALASRRFLLLGPVCWGDAAPGHDRALPAAWQLRLAPAEEALGVRLHAWGRAEQPSLPMRAGWAMLPDSAAVLGLARNVGAALLTDITDALNVIASARWGTVLIHDAGPDRAAHDRDPAAKRAAIERFDANVIGPVVAVAHSHGATVIVSPDHGCDPSTGAHTADPVPATWPGAPGVGRLTEPATEHVPAVDAAATVLDLAPRWQEAA